VSALAGLAALSAWNRRFVLSLIVLSIALSTLLLLGIERLRSDVHETFVQSISGTDLIVGARTGPVQLLLYSVFHIGGATNNVRWTSAQDIARLPGVEWMVPVSLGDSHRGFPVVATTGDYFKRFHYGDHQALALQQGAVFTQLFDAVIGAEVAQRLNYRLGDHVVLSHGDGELEDNDHADKPFTVVGILRETGTPVDRSVHIGLAAMEALHLDWAAGTPLPELAVSADQASHHDLTPKSVTAVLLGLKNRAAVFATQRAIGNYTQEPLMAVLPGIALDQLWEVVGIGERGLVAMSALVSLVSLAGLVAVIMAGLNERRRELAILRAVGAGPAQMLVLLAAEGAFVTLCGVVLGALAVIVAIALLGGWAQSHLGLGLHLRVPNADEALLVAAIFGGGVIASLAPGYRAYRLSLADGLSPRV
jgi:putative ABC transport system permease protein